MVWLTDERRYALFPAVTIVRDPLSDAQKRKLGNKYDLINLFLETYNSVWFENEELADTTSRKSEKFESVDLSEMPLLEGKEK